MDRWSRFLEPAAQPASKAGEKGIVTIVKRGDQQEVLADIARHQTRHHGAAENDEGEFAGRGRAAAPLGGFAGGQAEGPATEDDQRFDRDHERGDREDQHRRFDQAEDVETHAH